MELLLPITPEDAQWCIDHYADICKLAALAHDGQKDKGGNDYILHLVFVAKHQRTYVGKVLAMLHDSIEDEKLTAQQLRAAGVPLSIIQRLEMLTKRPTQDYEDYIRSLAVCLYLLGVKEWDLRHNMQIDRLKEFSGKDLPRLKKYHMSLQQVLEFQRAFQPRS